MPKSSLLGEVVHSEVFALIRCGTGLSRTVDALCFLIFNVSLAKALRSILFGEPPFRLCGSYHSNGPSCGRKLRCTGLYRPWGFHALRCKKLLGSRGRNRSSDLSDFGGILLLGVGRRERSMPVKEDLYFEWMGFLTEQSDAYHLACSKQTILLYFEWSAPWHFETATLTSPSLCICQVRVVRFYVSLISSSSLPPPLPLPPRRLLCCDHLRQAYLQIVQWHFALSSSSPRFPVSMQGPTSGGFHFTFGSFYIIPLNSREASEMLLHHRSSKHDAPRTPPLAAQHNPDKPPRYAKQRDATAAPQLHIDQQDHSQHAEANLPK